MWWGFHYKFFTVLEKTPSVFNRLHLIPVFAKPLHDNETSIVHLRNDLNIIDEKTNLDRKMVASAL